MEKVLKVEGMHCRSCEMLVSDALSDIKGVASVRADSGRGIVMVSMSDGSLLAQVKEAIEKEGYRVVG